jgi:hypothetical protein
MGIFLIPLYLSLVSFVGSYLFFPHMMDPRDKMFADIFAYVSEVFIGWCIVVWAVKWLKHKYYWSKGG